MAGSCIFSAFAFANGTPYLAGDVAQGGAFDKFIHFTERQGLPRSQLEQVLIIAETGFPACRVFLFFFLHNA